MRYFKYILIIFLTSSILFVSLKLYDLKNNSTSAVLNKNSVTNTSTSTSFSSTFKVDFINEEIRNRIYGISWKEGSPVNISSLRYVVVSYYGFDGNTHKGELIVHESVAEEVKEIFRELYYGKYPINDIKLIDEYNADDEKSMENNNTSAFCFRTKTAGEEVSIHSYGLSIDINPLQNPYIKGDIILPKSSNQFVDRSIYKKGMIMKDDLCYKAFTNRGWTWGGEWQGMKDYQHFEKKQ